MPDPGARPRRDGWHGPLEVLVDEAALARRVAELGQEIARDLGGGELCLVCVLKGSFLFAADLARALPVSLTCEFVGVSSYGDAQASSGTITLTQDVAADVAGRDVLLVEDIVDSGLTLAFLRDLFVGRGARSVRACSLLDKPAGRRTEVVVEYVGFAIPDLFVVGYGLDSAGRLRNLPFVGVVPADGA